METTELKLREVQQLKSLAGFQIFSEPRDLGFLSPGEPVDQFPLRCAHRFRHLQMQIMMIFYITRVGTVYAFSLDMN